MKKIFLIVLLVGTCSICSCKTNSPQTDNRKINQPTSDIDGQLIRQYEKEGFIEKNKYIILFVKPTDSTMSDSEIEIQIKKRAQSSLRKTIQDSGLMISSKSDTKILNVINDNGKILKLNDTNNSRTIYVLEIQKDNIKSYILNNN